MAPKPRLPHYRLKQSAHWHAALVDAAAVRLRRILMTMIARLAGLLPMAIEIRSGSEANARPVVGGFAVSTVLTLFFVPSLYSRIEARQVRSGSRSRGD
jgi:heavy metal efflux system protein